MLDRFLNYLNAFEGESVRPILVEHLEIPVLVTTLYVIMVMWVPDHFMKNREPYNLKRLNTFWNILLTAFSITGAYYTLPMLYKTIFVSKYEAELPGGGTETRTGSFYNCICAWNPTLFYDGPVGAFVCFFILSKLPEMLDTAFLVLQKKNVVFLHWYHHITVMLFCWHAYTYMITSGLIFAAMNYGVHSIMYLYYLMCSLGYRPYVRRFAPLITFLQIAQMVVGTVVEICSLYHIYISGKGCASNVTNCRLGLMMYASYFLLFTKLFNENYLSKKEKRGTIQEETEKTAVADATIVTSGYRNGNGEDKSRESMKQQQTNGNGKAGGNNNNNHHISNNNVMHCTGKSRKE